MTSTQLTKHLLTTVLWLLCCGNVFGGSWEDNLPIGGFEKVHIYTPDSDSPVGEGKALLIVLHGCRQSIDTFKTANLDIAADAYGMIIALPEAKHKAGFGCWHYWHNKKSRQHGDYQNLVQLAIELSDDQQRNIDPNQVYIAGLSSGAVYAHTAACLAPDIFAGVGASAGPSVGTSPAGAIRSCEAADIQSRCRQYAGSEQQHLDTQITSIAHGSDDHVVHQCYVEQNAKGMAQVYGISKRHPSNKLVDGTLQAEETLWEDGRVSMLWLNNLDHSWSGGAGATGYHISDASINYASYLGEFFSKHNQRVKRTED